MFFKVITDLCCTITPPWKKNGWKKSLKPPNYRAFNPSKSACKLSQIYWPQFYLKMLPNHRQRWWQGASVPSFEEEESCNFWWKNWRELGVFWFSAVQSLADEVWAREPLWEWHRRKGMEQHQLRQHILKCELVSLVWCFLFSLQFGIEDLKALPDQTSCWDGVRNYQVEPQHRVLQKEDVYLK